MLLNTTFRAFRHRDYFIYWLGLFLRNTGTLVQTWLLFQLTHSTLYLGLEGALPWIAAGAVFCFRRRRRRPQRPQNHFCPNPNFLRGDGSISRRDASADAAQITNC